MDCLATADGCLATTLPASKQGVFKSHTVGKEEDMGVGGSVQASINSTASETNEIYPVDSAINCWTLTVYLKKARLYPLQSRHFFYSGGMCVEFSILIITKGLVTSESCTAKF